MAKKIFSFVFISSLILLASGCKSMQGKVGGDGPGGGGGGGKKPGANEAQAQREPEFIDRDNNGVDDREEQQEQDGPAPFSQAAQNGLDGSAPSLSSGNQQPSVAEPGISGSAPVQPSSNAAVNPPSAHAAVDVGVLEQGRPASTPELEVKPADEKKTEEVKTGEKSPGKTSFQAFQDSLRESASSGFKALFGEKNP